MKSRILKGQHLAPRKKKSQSTYRKTSMICFLRIGVKKIRCLLKIDKACTRIKSKLRAVRHKLGKRRKKKQNILRAITAILLVSKTTAIKMLPNRLKKKKNIRSLDMLWIRRLRLKLKNNQMKNKQMKKIKKRMKNKTIMRNSKVRAMNTAITTQSSHLIKQI